MWRTLVRPDYSDRRSGPRDWPGAIPARDAIHRHPRPAVRSTRTRGIAFLELATTALVTLLGALVAFAI